MLEHQASMAEEGKGQRRVPTDAGKARMQWATQRQDVRWAEVGEFTLLHTAPHALDRIELGGIGGQGFDRQPRPLPRQIALHPTAPVSAEAVPDQQNRPATEMPF